jgi:hypothetical protein
MKDRIAEKYEQIQANASNFERQRRTKELAKKLKTPDITKMFSITVPAIRAVFYEKTKKRLNIKISELKNRGLEFTVKTPKER